MKKLIIILLAVCLVFTGVIGFFMAGNKASEEASGDIAEKPEMPQIAAIDYDAVFALHDPKEVVAVIDGKDLLWENYFYNVFSQAQQTYEYFAAMANYGMPVSWSDAANESGDSFAKYSVDMAEQTLLQLAAINGFTEKNNVVLNNEIKESMEKWKQEQIKNICGEDADEEAFAEALKEIYMSPEMFDEMNEINHRFQQSYVQIYGNNGEKYSDEDVFKFMEDNNYIHANHILISTFDPETNEDLDEAAMNEKKAKAEELSAELREIKDHDKLIERFGELKDEFCEDTGKAIYPDGMSFTPGTMVQEFEDGCKELKEFEVSEPVKSQFGYHVIIRLPYEADAIIGYTQNGTALTVRGTAANVELNNRFQEYLDNLSIEYAEGFEIPNLLDYIVK